MTPTRPETPDAAAAKKRLDQAATDRDKAIEAAHRAYWTAVASEIKAKNLTQTAAATHLDFSREHVRKQILRFAQTD
ncbi:hypothetical protein ACFC5T_40300 [Streptomyces sp. NPDC055961]|uniref:hypothetical protein n=1 Tax=Streptomyces sp. NPDC055961 TaxID=3345666 RepID=UPI0035DD0E2A